jgi:uncharacterized membrane protein
MSQGGTEGVRTNRVEELVDGVFAIAMTLLVLDLQLPIPVEGQPHRPAVDVILSLGPAYFSYALSFIVIAVFWVAHHHQFHFLARVNRVSIWLNMLILALVAFIPFVAKLLSRYTTDPVAVGFYGTVLFATTAANLLHWEYATRGRRLVEADLPESVVRAGRQRFLLGLAAYGLGLALLPFAPRLSLACYVLSPLLFLGRGKIDAKVEKHPPGGEAK